MTKSTALEVQVRSARLEDAEVISSLYNDHSQFINEVGTKSTEKIRLAIGSSLLNKNSYHVAVEHGEVVGYIEQIKQNNSHVLLSYPFVDIHHEHREEIQKILIERLIEQLQSFGYQFVSTQINSNMYEARQLFSSAGFSNVQSIYQQFRGKIQPDYKMEYDIEFRRVKIHDADLVYSWIERQLNHLSPISITKEHFQHLLHAPKNFRDGWALALHPETGEPVGMVSSMVDQQTGGVVVFGPFSAEENIRFRIPLFNELMIYHQMHGRNELALMRINLFDNDKELIEKYDLVKNQELLVMTRTL